MKIKTWFRQLCLCLTSNTDRRGSTRSLDYPLETKNQSYFLWPHEVKHSWDMSSGRGGRHPSHLWNNQFSSVAAAVVWERLWESEIIPEVRLRWSGRRSGLDALDFCENMSSVSLPSVFLTQPSVLIENILPYRVKIWLLCQGGLW